MRSLRTVMYNRLPDDVSDALVGDFEAFTRQGSDSQRVLAAKLGGQLALACGVLAIVLCAVNPDDGAVQWLTVGIGVFALLAGWILLRWPRLMPLWLMDVLAMSASGLLLLSAAYGGGPLEPAWPFIYVVLGTGLFVLRRWPVALAHTAFMGASYAGVLILGPPAFAPVTRWIAVMAAVATAGVFIRWLVGTVSGLVLAEHEARAAAEQASIDLAAVSAAKTTFLARMSHELRTPLNVVLGFSDLLGEQRVGKLSDRQREYVEDISASARHLVSLVDDVLDIAKVETGHVDLQVTVVDVAQVVDGAVAMVRERATNGGITILTDISPRVGAIEADERKLRQVVVNLLINAVKFTPPGGQVHVTAQRRADRLHVDVRDTGVGIAPEDMERIFEAYEQAEHAVEGAGLGLPLARRFVELHDGRLWAESRVGAGSTFRFEMPTCVQALHDEDAEARSTASARDYSAFTRPGSAANRAVVASIGSWLALLAAGLGVVFAVVTPLSLQGRLTTVAIAFVGLVVGLVARRTADALPLRGVESFGGAGIVAITLLIFLSEPFADLMPLAYGWITMTTFALWPLRRAIGHILFVAACYGGILILDPQPAGLSRWMSVMTVLAVNGVVVSWVTQRLRSLVAAEQSAHQRAEDVRAQLEVTSKHKSDFLANTSHELRTPLNAVVGFSELLASGATGPLNKKQQEYIHDVQVAASHLLSLIDDLLDLARLEAGQLQLADDIVAVPDLMERVVGRVAASALQSGVALDVDVQPDVDLVAGDPHRLEQVLVSLASNAVKFTPNGGRVELRAYIHDKDLCFAVRDTGIGILPEQRDHIFEAFHQGTRVLVDHLPEGPGLGLSLAKGLVELHGGRIWVDSEPDRGSRFTLAIPLRRVTLVVPEPEQEPRPGQVVADVSDPA